MKRKFTFRWLLTLFAVFSLALSSYADNCSQTFTQSGQDDDPTTVTIVPSDITCNAGGTITGITLNNTAGSFTDANCGSWFDFTLIVDGTTVIANGCSGDFDGTVISSSFSTIEVHSNDLDAYSDAVTITFDLDIVYTPAACPAPSDQTESNITSSSVDLSWTENGSAATWNIEYGPAGFAQGTGNQVTANNNPSYTLTGLTAGITYDWYVQADCGSGSTSSWTGPSTFCTTVTTFPYITDFENSGSIPDCWTNDPNDAGGEWQFVTTSSHGATADHTSGTGYYALLNDYSVTTAHSPFNLLTPTFDLSSGGPYQITYWAWIGPDGDANPIHVDVSDDGGTNWTTDVYVNDQSTTSSWFENTVPLSSYTTNNVIIRFRGVSVWGTGTDNSGIDDVTVEEMPACPAPSAQTESNITATAVDLGWTEIGSATTWNIEWGPTGFTQGTGTMVSGVTTNPYNLTGLTTQTTYDWYVQAGCGSTWTGPSTFTTAALTTGIPFTQDFESNSFGNYIAPVSNSQSDIFIDAVAANSSSYGVQMEGKTFTGWTGGSTSTTESQAWNDNATHISAMNMVVDATGETVVYLDFDLKQTYSYGAKYSWFRVVVNGSQVGVSYNPSTQNGDAFQTISVDLGAYAGTTFNLSLQHSGKYNNANGSGTPGGDNAYVDNISITAPTCPPPSSQATDSLKVNSAQLSWTETGSATEWNVRIGISGYDTTGTSYTVVTNDTLTVDTLLASTTYDWYVRASCGGGDYSTWIGPQTFTTSSGLATGPYPADGASGVLVNSDTLKWNPVAGATKYVLKVGTTSGDDDVLTSSTTDTAYITGSNWDYSTQYFWSVNTVYNGTNDTVTGSEWDFTTECGIYTPTYSQDFASYLPLCWSETEGFLTANSTLTGTSSYWTQDDFANVAINGKSAKLNIYGTTRKEWLISPSIDLSGDSYQLEFDLALTHFGTTNADTLGVDDTLAVIISTDNGATWSTSNILQVWTAATIISNTGEHVTIDLSAYTSLTKFAFYGASSVSNKDNDVFIDNFTVQIPPTCPAPSAQATDSIKLNAAQLSWTENGSATEWNIRIGTTGYDTTGASFSVVTNDTITVDTLLASTTYDWYVRATCGVGDYSSWIGPQTFTTSSGLATGPYPANGASKVLVNSDTLKWNPVAGATKYVLNVGTTSGGGDVLSGYSTTDTTYIKGSNWDYTTQYFWSVNTVYNGINDTVTGTEWDFTTECDATTVPYFEDFDAVTAPDFPGCMTVENTNGDAYEWETSADGLSSPNAAKIRYNSGAAMDDWFFTNGLQLTGGVTYEVQFVYRAASSNFPEKLAVDWGTAASSTAMSGNPIFDNTNVTNTSWYIGSGSFTPSATGNYYVGFHGHSDADEFYLYVDDIQVAEQQTTATWNGTASNEWDEPGNWSPGLPTSNTDITIPTGATNFPTLSHARQCNTITIESGATGDASILNDGLLVLSGDATIQRYLTAGVWHDFSPSAANQTLGAMYFGGSPNVWLTQYNEPDNSRTYLTTVTDTMPVGAGYEIWVDAGSPVTVNFIGTMNRSNVALTSASTPPLSYTGADPLGYNLIGNPFASPLALDSGAWNMANVDSTFWLWDGATYKDYNTTTKTGSMTGGIIPMGQGFFIHANAATPTITIPVAARVHSGQTYYKNTNAAVSSLEIMSLRATYNTDKNDELNIAFLNGAQDEFENHDTRKMFAFNGEAPQVYAIIPDEEVSLNSLPVLAAGEEKTVEVGYKAGTNGEQTLVADVSKLEDIDVVLEDLKINKIQNLNDNPVYKFDATTYQDPDRFRIHFNRSVTGIDNNEASTAVRAYSYNKTLYILSKGDMVTQTKYLDVYDILGRKVLSKKIPAGEVISVPVTVSDAYVVVRIISAGEVYTTKVYIK